jgi:hypothetical protein
MERKEYNGWFNYETWLVNLWLSNDQDSYDMVRDLIRNPYSDRAVYDLADALKEYIEESNPLASEANLFSDLINAALCEVNYDDIAEHWITDYKFDNPDPDKIDSNEVYEFNVWLSPVTFHWLTIVPDNVVDTIESGDSFWSQFNQIVAEADRLGMKSIIIEWYGFDL